MRAVEFTADGGSIRKKAAAEIKRFGLFPRRVCFCFALNSGERRRVLTSSHQTLFPAVRIPDANNQRN
jgi:hypothetical protein